MSLIFFFFFDLGVTNNSYFNISIAPYFLKKMAAICRTQNNKPLYVSILQQEFPAFPHMPIVCILKSSRVLQLIRITMGRATGMLIPEAGAANVLVS